MTLIAMGAVVLSVIAALLALRATAARRAEPPPPPPPSGSAAPPVRAPAPVAPPPAPPATAAATAGAAAPVARPSSPPPTARPVRPASPPAAEPPQREDAPFTIGPPDDHSGIRAFPPMGTKPVKRGIVVPDDFVLPQGYVRHFQSTDDGQRLPAILMFSPDFVWEDAQGRPVALPEDRVVPPELAPPGLPIEMLEPPAPPDPDRRP